MKQFEITYVYNGVKGTYYLSIDFNEIKGLDSNEVNKSLIMKLKSHLHFQEKKDILRILDMVKVN
jgi:hypothetical protein